MLYILTRYTYINWFGTTYAFHIPFRGLLNVNYPKPGYII